MEVSEYNIAEYNDIAALNNLRADWWRLLAETEGASFFMTPEWLETYWQYFGDTQRLVLLVAESGGEVCGITPLTIRQEERRVGNVKVLTYPLHDWGSFYSPVAAKRDAAAVLESTMRHLIRNGGGWDLLDLRWARPGFAAGTARSALHSAGMPFYETVRTQTALIDVRGTWEDYLARQKSKWRNNYRRWIKNLNKIGDVEYIRHRPHAAESGDGDPRWDLYEDCLHVASRSWQAASGDGTTMTHESISPFLRAMHAVASREGASDMNLLYVDRKPVAFAYNYHFNGYVYGLRIGYDASMGKAGAGNLLYVRAIEDSFNRNDHTYDLGPGTIDCKLSLLPEVVDIMQFTHFAPLGVKAQAMRLKHVLPAWMAGGV